MMYFTARWYVLSDSTCNKCRSVWKCPFNIVFFAQPYASPQQFKAAGIFETMWQVKFYNYNKKDHCQWGNSFRSIEYECKPNDSHSLMWISKETFL